VHFAQRRRDALDLRVLLDDQPASLDPGQSQYPYETAVLRDLGALPEDLRKFRVQPPSHGDALTDAIRTTLKLLDIAPRQITVPLLGFIWRVAILRPGISPLPTKVR